MTNHDISAQDLLDCAVAAARCAGNFALENAGRRNEVVKRLVGDVKLKLDLECQAKAEEIIRSAFPSHEILGEENLSPGIVTQASNAAPPTDIRHSPYRWIIDPIDGTVNFSHGLPVWCCSIAAQHQGNTVAGAIYAPAMKELYVARAGGLALCNDNEIGVSTIDSLRDSIVMTGLNRETRTNLPPFATFENIAFNVQRVRISGSAALDICRVALGQADGYFESGVYLWDVAAAGLIVRRAGGQSEIIAHEDNNHRIRFLATNGRIHAAMKELVKTRD